MITLAFQNGDVDIPDATGRPYYIQGIRKTTQDVAHTLLTEFDPNRGIGSELINFNDNVANGSAVPNAAAGFVRRYIEEAIDRLMTLQQSRRVLTPDSEFIKDIARIELFSGSSPTDIFFYAQVETLTEDVTPGSFRIQLGHQLPDSARAFMPGGPDGFTSPNNINS